MNKRATAALLTLAASSSFFKSNGTAYMVRSADLSNAAYKAARVRAEYEDATEPRAARGVSCSASIMTLPLRSGVVVIVSTSNISGLKDIHDDVRIANVVVEGRGRALHWPDLDIDLSVPLLLAEALPIRSTVSNARRAGSAKSPAKAAAVRENGKKGGQPRKRPAA
jgi:hypothetical protein